MEIRTKHVRAGFEAGLEGLKAVEIEQNNITKKGLFWTSKRKKKQAGKNSPSVRPPPCSSLRLLLRLVSPVLVLDLGKENLIDLKGMEHGWSGPPKKFPSSTTFLTWT